MPHYFGFMEGMGALLGVLVAFGSFWIVGRVVPQRSFWEYPLLGWTFVYVLSVVATLCGIDNLKIVVALAGALVVGSLIWRRPRFRGHSVIPYLIAIPVLALSVLTPPVFWDSYAHWLPNSGWLFQRDHFPEAPLVSFYSLHPTYPTALPLVVYISSLVAGFFTELAGNVTNAVLILLAMACLWQVLRDFLAPLLSDMLGPRVSQYVVVAIAFCIALPLNPAIEVRYYWSAIADPSLAVLALVMTIGCCRLMASEQGPHTNRSLFVLFTLGCLAAGLKPNAWLLAVVMAVSAGFVGIVHRIPFRRWAVPALAILGGTVFGTVLWKLYLRTHLDIPDQFSVQGLSTWRFDLAPALFLAMLRILETHTVYSTLVLASMAAGIWSFIRRSSFGNLTVRLAIGFITIAMALHLATLFAAYLGGGFDERSILTASSFPRYTSQAGYAVCSIGLLAFAFTAVPFFAPLLTRIPAKAMVTLCVLGCVGLFLLQTARVTLNLEELVSDRFARRQLAFAVLEELPGHRVAAAGARWSLNYLRYGVFAHMEEAKRPTIDEYVMLFEADDHCGARDAVTGWLADPAIDIVLLIDAGDFAARCMHNPAPDQVWRRSAGKWEVLDLNRVDPSPSVNQVDDADAL
jgi:hypothetical protein